MLNRSYVLRLAHSILQAPDSTITDFAAAQRQAWKAARARRALKSGPVTLTFVKATGEVTERRGSAFTDLPTRSGRPGPVLVVPFFSITDQATRSFRADRLIGFTPFY